MRLGIVVLVGIASWSIAGRLPAQGIPASDGSLAVGGYGAAAYGGGMSYGVSSFTPPNSSYPLTYYGFGRPALGPIGNPILGGGPPGYGAGFGYPAIGVVLSPAGGFGFPTYGYPIGSGGFVAAPYAAGFGIPLSPYGVSPLPAPPVPSGAFNPLLPVGLSPLAVQSALGERRLVDRVGVSRTFRSTAGSLPPGSSPREPAAAPASRPR